MSILVIKRQPAGACDNRVVFPLPGASSEGVGLGISFLPYATGFVVATTLLHMLGVALGLGLDRLGPAPSSFLKRAAGSVGAFVGMSLLAGWLFA
jgi:urease accessory protein